MSETQTASLTDFLLARIAEDEAVAERGRSHPDPTTFANDNYGYLWVQPARVLAECEAHRQIVAEHEMTEIRPDDRVEGYSWDAYCRRCTMDGEYTDITREPRENPCPTLRALAGVYADHPDCRQEWRP